MSAERAFLGCDIGSLFSKAVVLDGQGEVLASQIIPTTGDMGQQVRGLIQGVLEQAGVESASLGGTLSTGRGRDVVPGDDIFEDDELACVGWAARRFLPEVDLVVDIGGQSITSMRLDASGEVADFGRNDKCASGTGRFLELMSEALGIGLDALDSAAARSTRPAPISTQCGVFVESEVVTHINAGETPEDIAAGLCEAAARIISAQARRFGLGSRYTLTGGVARLQAVVERVQQHLDGLYQPFPQDPKLAAAIGAALLAAEEDSTEANH